MSVVLQSMIPARREVSCEGAPIPADVLDVLRECAVEGGLVRLPARQLDRKLYTRVNDVLVALGGKWTGAKVKAHTFDDDPSERLQAVVEVGRIIRPQDYGFFPTPKAVAEQLASLAALKPGMLVLEPSAGRGSLAEAAAARVGGRQHVAVVEALQSNAQHLLQAGGWAAVVQGDFMSIEPVAMFDRVIMNPPFERQQDIDHVLHAGRFLKPGGVLAAIMSPSWRFRQNTKSESFLALAKAHALAERSLESGTFKESGTQVATTMLVLPAAAFEQEEHQPAERPRERIRAF